MEAVNPFSEATEEIIAAGGEALKSCYQCGLCTATCPWNLVRTFLTRRLIHEAQIGLLVEVGDENVWLCATCGHCVERCPRGVAIIDIFRAARRLGAKYGAFPKTLKTVTNDAKNLGNPWSEPREQRADWAKDLGLKTFTAGTEYLYSPCCTPAYSRGTRRIALATAQVLKKAGVDFGILGTEESCCGESIRKVGKEDVFQGLAQSNIKAYQKHGVKKIIVSSPHCYHTMKEEYPEFGGAFEVIHITQLLSQLIAEGKIKPVKPFAKKVAYHDPCYLGRHHKIYDEPRNILKSIPGLELVELPDNRTESLCCGGGGGRIWMETKKEERFSDLRVDQALSVGAEVLALSCPYCMLNFDDSVLTMGKEGKLKIMDITEILNDSL